MRARAFPIPSERFNADIIPSLHSSQASLVVSRLSEPPLSIPSSSCLLRLGSTSPIVTAMLSVIFTVTPEATVSSIRLLFTVPLVLENGLSSALVTMALHIYVFACSSVAITAAASLLSVIPIVLSCYRADLFGLCLYLSFFPKPRGRSSTKLGTGA